MRYHIPLNSRFFLPANISAIQGRTHVTHACTLALTTLCSRPATDQMETPRFRSKTGVDRDAVHRR